MNAAIARIIRPYPPEALREPDEGGLFVPAPDLAGWMRATFISEQGKLSNKDHSHLRTADIGTLWTNVPNTRQMRSIVGTAELAKPPSMLGRWAKARWQQQMIEWFGAIPHFIITLYAPYAAEVDDTSFCATSEHELYHCAQARDEWGSPKFSKRTGPVYAMLGHGAEEFPQVVRRYGVGAAAGGVAELVEAASHEPLIAPALVMAACGTCQLRLN